MHPNLKYSAAFITLLKTNSTNCNMKIDRSTICNHAPWWWYKRRRWRQ